MKKIKTFEELLASGKLRELLEEQIKLEYEKRQLVLDEASQAQSGKKRALISFVSDPFGRLAALGKLNPDDLIEEFNLIDNKQSKLASGLRNFIYVGVMNALMKTEQHFMQVTHASGRIVY